MVDNCLYTDRDYLMTKAKMPTNSEAIGAIAIVILLSRVMRGQEGEWGGGGGGGLE